MPAKRYFSNIPNQSFYFEDGKACLFANGFVDIEDARQQAQLDAVLGKQTTIFTKDVKATDAPLIPQNALDAGEIASGDKAIVGMATKITVDTAGPDKELINAMSNATFDSEAAADQANAEMQAATPINPAIAAARARAAATAPSVS